MIMGLVERVLDVMHLNADDEYDEEDYLDEEDDVEEEYDEAPRRSFFRRKNEDLVEEEQPIAKEKPKREQPQRTAPVQSKVTPFRSSNSRKQVAEMGVCVIKPTSFDDAREVTETILKGRTVVLNMEGLNMDVAQRIIDFACGSCFALSGNLQKISAYIFIVTPPNVEISGDFADLLSGGLHADF